MTCKTCHARFTPKPDKKGYINECPDCASDEPERIGGNMIYLHKTGPYIELKPIREAKAFAKKTKRLGAGVTASLVQPKNSPFGNED